MTLHDRIMEFPETFCSGPDGWTIASEAAQLAKEADELMAEMAEALDCYKDEAYVSGPAKAALAKYNAYKERLDDIGTA